MIKVRVCTQDQRWDVLEMFQEQEGQEGLQS